MEVASRFEQCLKFVLKWEGGRDNDPNDPGGRTSFGIDQRDHPNVNVATLTLAQAKEIYRQENWIPFKCAFLNPPWDLLVFDSSVNPGPGFVTGALQGCVGATVDNYIGPKTIAATNAASNDAIKCFIKKRVDYYGRLRLSLRRLYMAGWINRTNDLNRVATAEAVSKAEAMIRTGECLT